MWKPFEPGSSPIDWCEGNYSISPSIAEFMNTLSNALFVLLPPVLMHLFRDYGRFVNPGIHVIWFLLMVVGISSAYFHATLSLIFPSVCQNSRKIFSLYTTLVTVIGTVLAMFHPAVNAFALMTLSIPASVCLVLELKRTKSQRVYRLGLRCGAILLLAITCWLNDRLFCDTWLNLNFPYLHALWHLFIFIASYTATVLFAYFSVKEERPHQTPMLKYWPRDDFELGIPYVTIKSYIKIDHNTHI
ncbi:unnamed protein product [Trichogramma brassicae]|uniref:Alkaline ceramidase n=1 Tax=Trichogramma brassicae TaxID=86971 RepID=A0A6H5IGE8_9HYME|nr:unnamed protein product [Trichogramma brassicae]